MFWILRRTGAANFFNSLNNNCSTSKGNGSAAQDKYVKRPPRKAYGRLSADSDDNGSMKQTADDPFDDIDNFEIITGKGTATTAATTTKTNDQLMRQNGNGGTSNGGCLHAPEQNGGGNCSGPGSVCSMADCMGNYAGGNVCDLSTTNHCSGIDGRLCETNSSSQRQKEVNANTINRLQAMALSDDDDYDESLTCNVCDRAFHCHRQLASHQQKKRHFGCGGCDSLFPSLMLLEHHKEEFEHWSDDEISRRVCCRRNRGDDYFTDTDSFTSDAESEDLERLL